MTRTAQVLLNIVLLAAVAEGGARLAERWWPPQEDVAFGYAPYRMLKMTAAPFALNADGFRAAEWDAYRGKFVVEFLGGSVCLGVGTNPGPPLPERLEAALRRAGLEHAAVVNLCQGGTASAQELAILLQYGLPLRPQVVLSFNGANDLLHPRPMGEDDAPNLPYHHRELEARFDGRHGWLDHAALRRVSDRIVRRLPMPGRRFAMAGPPVAPRAILDSYLYVTQAERTLAEAHGAMFAVLLQPSLHYAKPWSPEERAMWTARRPNDAEAASAYAADLFAQLRAETAASGLPVYDLTRTFERTTATVYSDSVHFSGGMGFRMLAEELERQGVLGAIVARYRAWEAAGRRSGLDDRSLAWRR
jgi:hypothetical protein